MNFDRGTIEPTFSQQEVLKIFLGYSDLGHERIGRSCCDTISTVISPPSRTVVTEWKFQMLAALPMLEMAVDDAAAADVLIVTTSAREGLPQYFQPWLDRWSTRVAAERAILALVLTHSEFETKRLMERSQLMAQASSRGIEILILESSGNPEKDDQFWFDAARRLAERRSIRADTAPPDRIKELTPV